MLAKPFGRYWSVCAVCALMLTTACDMSVQQDEEGMAKERQEEENMRERLRSDSPCETPLQWSAQDMEREEEILVLVNKARARGANCGFRGSFEAAKPLTMNPKLRCAARLHAVDMNDRDYFDHRSPEGEGPRDRIKKAGYEKARAWGENIAAGRGTPEGTMRQWMESDGHCANIMNPKFTEIGVGYAAGGQWRHMWAQVFGRS